MPAAQLFRTGRYDRWPAARTGRRSGAQPVLPSCQRRVPPAAGHPGDRGDLHRQPGGDLGRLQHYPPGHAAGLHAAPVDPPHQRNRGGPDLHSGGQLGADGRGDHPRADLPDLVEPRGSLWHRGDRRGDDRYAADGRAVRRGVEMEMVHRTPGGGLLPDRRRRLFRGQSGQGPRRRLVPAGGRSRGIHATHDLGARAQTDARPDERDRAADRDFRQEREEFGNPRAGHCDLHGQPDRRRAERIAAQYQAQQGAARTRGDPHRADCRQSLCRQRQAV